MTTQALLHIVPSISPRVHPDDHEAEWVRRVHEVVANVPHLGGSVHVGVLSAYVPGSVLVNASRTPEREAWLLACSALDGEELQEALDYLATEPALTDPQGRPLIRPRAERVAVRMGR